MYFSTITTFVLFFDAERHWSLIYRFFQLFSGVLPNAKCSPLCFESLGDSKCLTWSPRQLEDHLRKWAHSPTGLRERRIVQLPYFMGRYIFAERLQKETTLGRGSRKRFSKFVFIASLRLCLPCAGAVARFQNAESNTSKKVGLDCACLSCT